MFAVKHQRISARTYIDSFAFLYVGWIVLSALVNVGNLGARSASDNMAALVSLLTQLFLMSPFLLGREYVYTTQALSVFFAAARIAVAISIVVAITLYLGQPDLYAARSDIGQRIPLVLTFFVWGLFAIGISRRGQTVDVVFWVLGTVLLLLALSRAGYLQWTTSAIGFLALIGWRNLGSLFAKSLFVASIGLLLFHIVGITDYIADTIGSRMQMILNFQETAETDQSASLRLAIWKGLLGEITKSPLAILFGSGQLGPSSVGLLYYGAAGVATRTSAHSQYIDTLFRSGIVGALLETGAVLAVIYYSVFKVRVGLVSPYIRLHGVALIGSMVFGIFHETLRWHVFGLYFWLYAGALSGHVGGGRNGGKQYDFKRVTGTSDSVT